jgi:hypothetical protein
MFFYRYTCMPEMAFSAFLFRTNILNTQPKEGVKPPRDSLYMLTKLP